MFEVTRKHRGENRQHRKLAKLAISGLDCYVAKHNPTVQEFFFSFSRRIGNASLLRHILPELERLEECLG